MKKYSTADRLRQIMTERNLKQVDILNLASPFCKKYDIKLNKNDLSQYVSGKVEPGQNKLYILGLALNVSEAWLMGFEVPIERLNNTNVIDISNIINIEPLPKMKKVPLLGTIACGEPILAEENIEDYINMPESTKGTFALRCKGDSMINARIFDGDIVYIREQPDVENGEIAAVLIDNEATLKRVYKYENRIELRPENPTFKVLNYENEELNNIKILGKAVGFFSKVT
ncbi:MAG: transcriptional repressor LexA [Ruminococcus sp.]|nr:transcriptional repressor LexA [Ruminococcus sp.]